ncbi:hypothetical protein BpHYR1_031644 [Brachionus plicatilis]|uniref:DUF659 domain-containing protein n=1 Tax=Brachionus plicatilis TaxID=10195 RepID=A0A3M7S849_BRAPC|nr:hypothetical protein BpHYR1_031644 [Brachionus plicatilis]
MESMEIEWLPGSNFELFGKKIQEFVSDDEDAVVHFVEETGDDSHDDDDYDETANFSESESILVSLFGSNQDTTPCPLCGELMKNDKGVKIHIIHYQENFAFRSFALGFKCMTERHRAEDIKKIVFEILSEYGTTEKVLGIVTDNNSTVFKASRLMKEEIDCLPIHCMGHELQLNNCNSFQPSQLDEFEENDPNFSLKQLAITIRVSDSFSKLSETMSEETYVTTKVKEDEISLSKDLKDAIKQSYDHYCNIYDLESNDFLIASTFLHPFYKEFEFTKNFLIDLFKSKRFDELIASSRKEEIIKSHSLKKS